MTRISRGARRLGGVAGTIAVLIGALAPSAHAAARYTKTATARATAAATSSARISEKVTASATVGDPPVTASATATATANAKATAKATASAKGTASASSASVAKKRALAKARTAARAAALHKARTLAYDRAVSTARTHARAAALTRAKAAALAKANSLPQPAPGEPCDGPITAPTGQVYGCTFDEEFNGTTLDPTKWQPITTAATSRTDGPGCFMAGPDNISVSGGALRLTARKEAAPFQCTRTLSTQYSTGQVGTARKFYQTYGRFVVRAKFPNVRVPGLQTSLWLWPENNLLSGLTGEIDIAEWYSERPDYAVPTIHYQFLPETVSLLTGTNVTTAYDCQVGDLGAFHTYGLEWTRQRMTITIDDKVCLINNYSVLGLSPFDQPFFIALSAALGQTTNAFDPAVTPLPATTEIDWVRAWKIGA